MSRQRIGNSAWWSVKLGNSMRDHKQLCKYNGKYYTENTVKCYWPSVGSTITLTTGRVSMPRDVNTCTTRTTPSAPGSTPVTRPSRHSKGGAKGSRSTTIHIVYFDVGTAIGPFNPFLESMKVLCRPPVPESLVTMI